MARETSLVGTTKHLDGGACLNQRSILSACELFVPSESTTRPLKLAELLESLWFLELAIVSKGITYDGTLPQRDLDRLTRRLADLTTQAGFDEHYFDRIAPQSFQEQTEFMCAAGASALEDLSGKAGRGETRSFGPRDGLDLAFGAASSNAFFTELERLRREAKEAPDGFVGADRLDDLANRSGLRGGKCLAGMAALGETALEHALELPARLGIGPGLAMSTLINRFRFTYVRQLAFGARDVYVPAARWKPLSEFHAFTFAEVVRQHFERQFTHGLSKDLARALSSELGGEDGLFTIALPPLGLYALMNAPHAARPIDVVREARGEFSAYGSLFRHFWARTREVEPPPGGWTVAIGDEQMDAVHDRIEDSLNDKLGVLVKQAKQRNPSLLDRFLTSVIRIGEIGGAGVGAVLGQNLELLVDGASGGGLATGAGASAGAAVGRLASGVGRRAKTYLTGHIDDYRTLEQTLATHVKGLRFDRLADQVEAVFGRKLEI